VGDRSWGKWNEATQKVRRHLVRSCGAFCVMARASSVCPNVSGVIILAGMYLRRAGRSTGIPVSAEGSGRSAANRLIVVNLSAGTACSLME
jgi:hypothetical protein